MEEGYTIQISSNLVSRLVSDMDKPKKKTRKAQSETPRAPRHPRINAKPVPAPVPETSTRGPSPWPSQQLGASFFPVPAPPAPVPNTELEAIRSVLHESENVLERLRKHEANMAEELTQRAKELHDKEFKLPYQKPFPCAAEKDACLRCYREHGKDPLKCSAMVRAFASCAHRARAVPPRSSSSNP